MRRSKRSKAREALMQMLFQMELQGDFSEGEKDAFIDRYFQDESQIPYVTEAYTHVRDRLSEIDREIEISSDNWKTSRMATADLTILRLAAAEIFYMEDIPDSVSANEAVELAKLYGGEESPKFINGILGRLIRGPAETAKTPETTKTPETAEIPEIPETTEAAQPDEYGPAAP
ncbi:MAG: transcription antitermination factor NusB [Clostridiales Family XIII bacterium]|jgi:N utilization substance protein B|nr:transcription antitermination factor NusB [Clostridiales Family XIII bacterium]